MLPTVQWEDTTVSFLPGDDPGRAGRPVYAALVFATINHKFVLADIAGRGWCIPGGRIEPGEEPEVAARREALEEIGAVLGPLRILGTFTLSNSIQSRAAIAFTAGITSLGERTARGEALGVREVSIDELPSVYYRWDPLLAGVFKLAAEQAYLPGC